MHYKAKNFTIFIVLFSILALICFYISALIAIGTISGYKKFSRGFYKKIC